MGHTKKKVRRRRRRRRGWQRTRQVRAYASELVERWARATGRDPDGEEARLLARLTLASGKHGLFSSNWIVPALNGSASEGDRRLEAIELLERFLAWAHEVGEAPVLDVGCQLSNLELCRRRAGQEPRTIALPSPRPDEDVSPRQLVGSIAQWEAFSYGAMCSAGVPDDDERTALTSAAITLTTHLAEADGVPTRFGRLDPVAYAAFLVEGERNPALGPAPARFVPQLLSASADFYAALRQRGILDREVAERIADELTVLAMGYASNAA